MADERTHNGEQLDTPIDESAQKAGNKQPDANQDQHADDKVHKVKKEKGEGPLWWQGVKNFFTSIFVTPWIMMQKILLRLAGGKQMVEEAEKAAIEDAKASKVMDAASKNAKFYEREMNDLLKNNFMQDRNWADGLHITHVKFEPNVTGDDSIMHSVTVTCNNGSEYQLHMTADKQLRINDIIPNELAVQLQALRDAVAFRDGETVPAGNSEFDEDAPEQGDDDVTPNTDGSINNQYLTTHVVVTPNPRVEADGSTKAVVEVTWEDMGEDAPIHGEKKFTAYCDDKGCIRIDGLDASTPSLGLITQSVYQAFKPFIKDNQTALAQKTGCDVYHAAAEQHFKALAAKADAVILTPEQAQKEHCVYIVPVSDTHVSMIEYRANPANAKNNTPTVHLNAATLDVTNGQNFQFQTVSGKTPAAPSDVKEAKNMNPYRLYTLALHPDLASKDGNALESQLMQFHHAATKQSGFFVRDNTYTLAYVPEAKLDSSGRIESVAAAHAVKQYDGFVLQVEKRAQFDTDTLRNIAAQTTALYGGQIPTDFSQETRETAAAALRESYSLQNGGKTYGRFFVMGDTVMSYDGSAITAIRQGYAPVAQYKVDTLDEHAVQNAYLHCVQMVTQVDAICAAHHSGITDAAYENAAKIASEKHTSEHTSDEFKLGESVCHIHFNGQRNELVIHQPGSEKTYTVALKQTDAESIKAAYDQYVDELTMHDERDIDAPEAEHE